MILARSNTAVARGRCVSARRVSGGNALLYQADLGRERLLNETGTFIWDRLDGRLGPQEIAVEMTAAFAGIDGESAASDVQAFAAELLAQGFVEPASDCTVTPVTHVELDDAPKQVDVSITGHCNAACTYCFYADEMAQRPDLPTNAWLAFFDELGSLAVRSVCLSGGEVFTRPDLWALIDRAIENRMRYSILSNGTLVDSTIVARLLERRTRLDSIQVSIDGSSAEIHDASRGRGSFEKALRGLRLLKQAGLPVTSRVTINRHNAGDLERIAELLLDDVGLRSFGTNDAIEMGSCRQADSIRLPPELERVAMLSLARLDRRYPGRVIAMAGPLARWRMFHAMEKTRTAGGEPTPRMGRLTACGCVFDKIAVNHDGTITPCNMLATMVMGGIGETPIRDIWRNHPHLRALRERREIPMDDVAECQGCEWTAFCNGSCPAVQFGLTGSLRRPDPADCYRRFIAEVGHVPAL
jgi:SynChlorMet cassette radical SAM/SPASM protein ScmE